MTTFGEKTTEEDLMKFVSTLKCSNFKYRDVLACYAEFMEHEVVNTNQKVSIPSSKDPKLEKNRRFWSKEETDALKEGVEKFGVGKWAQILTHYENVFSVNERQTKALAKKWNSLKDEKKK